MVKDDDLSDLTLRYTFFGRSSVEHVVFSNADLTGSNMCWNDFTDCDFTGSDLSGCDMRGSQFTNCRFTGSILRNADLRHSSFENCGFADAEMTGTVVERANGVASCLSQKQRACVTWRQDSGPEPEGG